ncbi:phosphoethanolamine transferase [Algibacter sp. PT7-4]|uniref:phosphoethanolamine transferase n=1 Tax=Algibacter ulvanivorans TaxID=3400999 RepID=UPI003AB0DF73
MALDTNFDESKEFVKFYVDLQVIIITVLIFVLALFLLLKKIGFKQEKVSKPFKFKVSILFILILVFLKISDFIIYNMPYLVLKSATEYYVDSKKLDAYATKKNVNFNDAIRDENLEEELYVIILGESTSRSHLGLYNYYRNTTPKLDSLTNELLVYNNVISPHVYSIGAITKILTLGNYENPKKISEGSIIQLLNQVGFNTYWLSNQRPLGPFESMITKIAMSSNYNKFISTEIAKYSKVLDGELLHEFNKVINNDIKKKVVFIHLMGTHYNYEYRYPETFNKFKNKPKTKFLTQESATKINQYDNAVLYNDFIISEIISRLKDLNLNSFALYFSDHGEEMYDDINLAGHNEDIYSKKMFEIPFFLWRSEKYKASKQLFFDADRPYMTDDLFHSIADLISVKANLVDTTKSIFNKNFKSRKRIIKSTIDFDAYFNN